MRPLGGALRPKQPANFFATGLACVAILAIYLVSSSLAPWSPKRGAGLVFGFVAAAVMLFEMAYPWRRPRARPLFTARQWIQAHVYLGIVALLAVVVHAGFSWPRGGMGWWLLGLSAWTTLTGLFGVVLQKWLPAALAAGLRVEALYERIPALVQQLTTEADALVAEGGDALGRFYRNEVRAKLTRSNPSWAYLFDVRAGRDRALEPFRRITRFVDPADRERVEDLTQLYVDKLELDAQLSVQTVLRRWLVLHVPAAGLLMGLLVIHVLSWVWY